MYLPLCEMINPDKFLSALDKKENFAGIFIFSSSDKNISSSQTNSSLLISFSNK